MSISDVLFDAEEAIKEYLADDMITGFIGNVEGTPKLKAKVIKMLEAMSELRKELDTPPRRMLSRIETTRTKKTVINDA
jgi:hypothetical protein